jgi:O-antigen ligase
VGVPAAGGFAQAGLPPGLPGGHRSKKRTRGLTADSGLRKPRRFKLDALQIAIIVFCLAAVWRIQDLFPILGKIQLPLLTEAVVLFLFFTDKSPRRRVTALRAPVAVLIMALTAMMILGLPTSLWPGKGVSFILRDFSQTLVLFFVVAASIREFEDLDRLALGMLTGGVIYAGLAFVRHATLVNGRLSSLEFYDANDFALLLAGTMPFAIYYMRPGIALWKRLYALGAMGLFMIMMIRSGSRGGFLAFAGVMLYTLLRYHAIPARLRITAVTGGVLVLLVAGSSTYWEMMSTMLHPSQDYNMTSEGGRKEVWTRGIGYMLSNPITGVGIRAFPQAEGMLSEVARERAEMGRGIKWSVAHNSFVEVGAECGIPGLLLFVAILGAAGRSMTQVKPGRRRPWITRDDQAYAQMLIASLIGFSIAGFFVSAEYFTFLYVVLALTVGLRTIIQRRARNFHRATRAHAQRQANVQAWASTGSAVPSPAPANLPSTVPPTRDSVPWLPSGR